MKVLSVHNGNSHTTLAVQLKEGKLMSSPVSQILSMWT